MTDMDRTSAEADLAFLRELVDEGDWRRPARFFGAIYLAIGLAVIAQVAAIDLLPLPDGEMGGLAQLAAVIAVWVVYGVAQTIISMKMGPGKIGPSLRARAGAAGFLGMILSHLTLLAVFVIAAIQQGDAIFMKLAALSFSALQGGLWLMIHTLRRERWQLAVALGWLAGALVAAPFLDTPWFGYVVAVVVLLLMVAPGVHLLRVTGRAD